MHWTSEEDRFSVRWTVDYNEMGADTMRRRDFLSFSLRSVNAPESRETPVPPFRLKFHLQFEAIWLSFVPFLFPFLCEIKRRDEQREEEEEEYLNQPVSCSRFVVIFGSSSLLYQIAVKPSQTLNWHSQFRLWFVQFAALTSYYVIIIVSELLKAHIASTHQLAKPFIVFLFILSLPRRAPLSGCSDAHFFFFLSFVRLLACFFIRSRYSRRRAFTFSRLSSHYL